MQDIDNQLARIGRALFSALSNEGWSSAKLTAAVDEGFTETSLTYVCSGEELSPFLDELDNGLAESAVEAAMNEILEIYTLAQEPLFEELVFELMPSGKFSVKFAYEDRP